MVIRRKHIKIKNGTIDVENQIVWDQSRIRTIMRLNKIIADYASLNSKRIWLSPAASRNPFTSTIIQNLHIIEYIETMTSKGAWDDFELSFTTDSRSIGRVLEKIAGKYKKGWTIRVSLSFKPTCSMVKWCLWVLDLFIRYVVIKYSARKDQPEVDVLVDSFAFAKDCLGRRYYGKFVDWVHDRKERDIVFVPEIIERNPFKIYRVAKKCYFGAYIFKESFLSLADLVKIVFESALPFPRCTTAKLDSGIEVSGIINEQQNRWFQNDQVIRGLVTICFFKRYAALYKKPRLIIDWFENQVIDKAWNLGVRDVFPDSESLGYQAFGDLAGYWCIYPTDSEIIYGAVPKIFGVIGVEYLTSRFRFATEYKSKICPAFRFEYLWTPPIINHSRRKTMLVPLTISEDNNAIILSIIRSCVQQLNNVYKIDVVVKNHPVCKMSPDLVKIIESHPNCVFNSNEGFGDLLRKSQIVFGGVSNTVFEASLYGVVVFVCGLKNGSRGNFSVLDKLRNVFHVESNSEFLSALEKYQERKDLNSLYMFEEYSEIRSRYYRRPFDNDCESFIGV